MPQRKAGKKAISPIIAIIIILLITIAIAGAGYSYISAYWAGMTGRQIEVINALCVQTGNQGKIMVKNIGTSPLNTGDIAVINPLTGEDITGDVLWAGRVSDPGLVLQLRFEEGSGTLARDTSGQGNDGTLFPTGSGPIWTNNGKIGGALDFDGTDDYVDCGNDDSLKIGVGDYTVSAWFKTAASGGGILRHSGSYYGGEWVDLRASGQIWANLGKSDASISTPDSPLTYNDGIWHHMTTVFDRDGDMTVYVDGAEATSASIAAYDGIDIVNTQALRVGWALTGNLDGTIDEVSVYSRALSEDEIKALAENSVLLQPGETATLTHTCTGRCRYSLVLGGMAKEAMLEC